MDTVLGVLANRAFERHTGRTGPNWDLVEWITGDDEHRAAARESLARRHPFLRSLPPLDPSATPAEARAWRDGIVALFGETLEVTSEQSIEDLYPEPRVASREIAASVDGAVDGLLAYYRAMGWTEFSSGPVTAFAYVHEANPQWDSLLRVWAEDGVTRSLLKTERYVVELEFASKGQESVVTASVTLQTPGAFSYSEEPEQFLDQVTFGMDLAQRSEARRERDGGQLA